MRPRDGDDIAVEVETREENLDDVDDVGECGWLDAWPEVWYECWGSWEKVERGD